MTESIHHVLIEKHPILVEKLVSPEAVMERITPGMSIFIGTAGGEPRALVNALMNSDSTNLQDLELIQLVSLGDAISPDRLLSRRYRLKTFFSGWVASDAITSGNVDLIPTQFFSIPRLITSRQLPVDVAFIQVSMPNAAGYCSLGVAVDVARYAMDQASLVVGEINPDIPMTYGDSFISLSDLHLVVTSTEPPIYVDRWPVDEAMDQVASHIASVMEDDTCLSFSIGPLYEALGRHLRHKHNLGVHSAFFTDALMDLVQSGAVTNRRKQTFRGKSLTSYAMGTPELFKWLDRNPLVEFQAVDKVFHPVEISRNQRFTAIFPARMVDLQGRLSLPTGKRNITAGPAEVMNLIQGSRLSEKGVSIFGLRSRSMKGESNIRLTVDALSGQFTLMEMVDMVVTEFGIAHLSGRSVRERAQALIEIAHPDDRAGLFEAAKSHHILYPDQIFVAEGTHFYPAEIASSHVFDEDIPIRFRAIRPSDEEEMRRLFYRFSDEAVYYRYFASIKSMPHAKMQQYVNVDYRNVMSIVGLIGEMGHGHIIAEARYAKLDQRPWAEVAFIVDEAYSGLGIATFLYRMLIRLGKERGLEGFTADVLATNKGMMKVFEKGGPPFKAKIEYGAYSLTIPFDSDSKNSQ
jgi:acyl-CoA hydrolase/RimJ/RimL family protein N-acetyltransferase